LEGGFALYTHDTIAAIATPLGKGGVGIIRVSGLQSLDLAREIFRPRSKVKLFKPGMMYYGDFMNRESDLMDSGYFVWFKKPRSFTGEDVVEFHCHGGIIIMQAILKALFASGVRPADPGEFSKRAFLNGKIDLVQAEAVSDLINAQSSRAVEIARSHYMGRLTDKIDTIRNQLAEIIAWLEAEIDYPDTEVDYSGKDTAVLSLHEQIKRLKQLQNTYKEGRVYRDGVVTVILGKPNVGKSSLLNLLAGEERAIVTDIPGTTRDIVEVPVNIRGIPLLLADTAGIRASLDKVEQIGIERARALAAKADLVLLVVDMSRPLTDEDKQLLDTADKSSSIVVLNKADLAPRFEKSIVEAWGFKNLISVSVAQEEGLEVLKDTIEKLFISGQYQADETLVTNERHFQALGRAIGSLRSAADSWNDLPMDLLALDLREGWQTLGEVTGAVWSENLLDCVFSKFCLGK